MLPKTKSTEKSVPHDAPRTLLLIAHAHVYSFVEGWNETQESDDTFPFQDHAFNFDYLLHVSGINYLIHPEDTQQVIYMIQEGAHDLVEFNFRFINRAGEVKSLTGLARLVQKN